jgi:hypothetical protein
MKTMFKQKYTTLYQFRDFYSSHTSERRGRGVRIKSDSLHKRMPQNADRRGPARKRVTVHQEQEELPLFHLIYYRQVYLQGREELEID